jgi:hypothetical protein
MVKVRSGRLHAMHLWCFQVKQPSLKLKTRPKQLLCLPLDITLHDGVLYLTGENLKVVWAEFSTLS